MASAWQVPAQNATNTFALPRNIERAVFSISATGQIDEEFWYTDVLSSEVNTFPDVTLFGYSPFREVQLLIDGKLAGVMWPFPIIFTGGVVPGLWRPMVGIDAFDLREGEIDITPWLPLLCDGASHTFTIYVAGINDDGKGNGALTDSVGSYWVVTGKVFVWLDSKGSVTTGSMTSSSVPPPSISLSSSISKGRNGTNQTLTYDVAVGRELTISSNVRTSQGRKLAIWHQNLDYRNHDVLADGGNTQFTVQDSNGVEISSRGYARRFDYPITLNSTISQAASGNLTIQATINRGEDIQIAGQPTFPTGLQSFKDLPRVQNEYPSFQGSHLQTTQNGSAFYTASPTASQSFSYGSTQQEMVFSGFQVDSFSGASSFPATSGSAELYQRHVLAVNSTLVEDEESLVGLPIGGFSYSPAEVEAVSAEFAKVSIQRTLGRPPTGGRSVG